MRHAECAWNQGHSQSAGRFFILPKPGLRLHTTYFVPRTKPVRWKLISIFSVTERNKMLFWLREKLRFGHFTLECLAIYGVGLNNTYIY